MWGGLLMACCDIKNSLGAARHSPAWGALYVDQPRRSAISAVAVRASHFTEHGPIGFTSGPDSYTETRTRRRVSVNAV